MFGNGVSERRMDSIVYIEVLILGNSINQMTERRSQKTQVSQLWNWKLLIELGVNYYPFELNIFSRDSPHVEALFQRVLNIFQRFNP